MVGNLKEEVVGMLLKRKTLGLIMISGGSGMLVMFFLPGWGFFLAVIFLVVGIYLLNAKNC